MPMADGIAPDSRTVALWLKLNPSLVEPDANCCYLRFKEELR